MISRNSERKPMRVSAFRHETEKWVGTERAHPFSYNENPTLGAGGSEALLAMRKGKKTPFDAE